MAITSSHESAVVQRAYADGTDNSQESKVDSSNAFLNELQNDRAKLWLAANDSSTPKLTEALTNPGELGERSIGKPDAPVSVIVYSSMTCSHCADFEQNTLPALKEKYVDTGIMKIEYRDFPRDQVDLVASVIAHSLPKDKYLPFVDKVMERQNELFENPLNALTSIASEFGVSYAQIEQMVKNEKLVDALVARRNQAQESLEVTGTPTIFINGKKVVGNRPMSDFNAEVARILGASAP